MDKRNGRKTVMERKSTQHVRLSSYTLEEAVDFVMKVKRAKNLKERTISGYIQNMRYFIEWVTERPGDLPIHQITAAIIREYVLWCSKEKEYYGGHPYKSELQGLY
jgi:integrase/recombinase XerD